MSSARATVKNVGQVEGIPGSRVELLKCCGVARFEADLEACHFGHWMIPWGEEQIKSLVAIFRVSVVAGSPPWRSIPTISISSLIEVGQQICRHRRRQAACVSTERVRVFSTPDAQDGQGLTLAHIAGLCTGCITGRQSPARSVVIAISTLGFCILQMCCL
jgi:hypothetical protein